jgi:hypothetical protein
MSETLRTILSEIGALLESGGEQAPALLVREALSGSDEKLNEFLVSNELWGGMGSIADQAFVFDKPRLKQLENLMIKLGRLQIEAGKTNVRTQSWVSAFEHWLKLGLQ